jgi:hypothetical protein
MQFKEDMETTKFDICEQFDRQLKELITEFAEATQESEGLPSHRDMLDHTIKLNCYPPRQRRKRLCVPECEELKRQRTELFRQGKYEYLIVPTSNLL